MKRRGVTWAFICVCLSASAVSVSTAADKANSAIQQQLQQVAAVGDRGDGHPAAVAAAKQLAQAPAAELPTILAAMRGAGPVAANWMRGIVESVAQRGRDRGEKLPMSELTDFLRDTKQDPRARRLSYELLITSDPNASESLIRELLDDPSLELRRDAVAMQIDSAAKEQDKAKSAALYEAAFRASRDLDQIKATSAKLRELEQSVDIARQMGFVTNWKLIGPFDNVADIGWDTAYPPEASVDFAAEYDGQKGKVKWIDHVTQDDFGSVDLAAALDKHKGAVVYAAAEFFADRERAVDVRIGSGNATKVWLNGELLDAWHVYHAGDEIDQYIAHGKLKGGRNIVLLKVCQNEQTEGWAQDWKFQLRVCDSIGSAVLSQDRPALKTAKN